MSSEKSFVKGLELAYYTCPAVKNGISYNHKFSVLWHTFKHHNFKFKNSLN